MGWDTGGGMCPTAGGTDRRSCGVRARKRVDVKFAPAQLTSKLRDADVTVYKMHGDVSDPDNAVLTKDDYERYEIDRQAFTEILRTDLTRCCFLFLGFSFTDPNIEYILSRLRQMLKGANRIGVRPHPQCFACPQTGEGFKHHLPAHRFGAAVGKHQRGDFMQRLGVVRHELTAVPDIFGAAITRTPEVERVLPDEVAPHGPEDGVAQSVEFHVHRPVAASLCGVLPPPLVVAIIFNERNFICRKFVPILQQDRTIPRFHFQGAANTGLFLPVGITIFLVTAEDFADGHGGGFVFHQEGMADPGPTPVQFLAGEFKIFCSERTPGPPTAEDGPLEIGSRTGIPVNSRFNENEFPAGGLLAGRCFNDSVHVDMRFCVLRYFNEPLSPGE